MKRKRKIDTTSQKYLDERWEKMTQGERDEDVLKFVDATFTHIVKDDIDKFWEVWEGFSVNVRHNMLWALRTHPDRWPVLAEKMKAWMKRHGAHWPVNADRHPFWIESVQ